MTSLVRRIDLGMRDASGNHGILAIHDDLVDSIDRTDLSALLMWTDLTRAAFEQHWLWVPLSPVSRALIRVTPQSGGLRGMSSTAQAVVVSESAIGMATDLASLVRIFPSPPLQIGQAAEWIAPPITFFDDLSSAKWLAIAGDIDVLLGLTVVSAENIVLPLGDLKTVEEQVVRMLHIYALCPIPARLRLRPCFATSEAPPAPTPYYIFSRSATARPPGPAARAWRVATRHLVFAQLRTVDPLDTEKLVQVLLVDALQTSRETPLSQAQTDRLFAMLGDLSEADLPVKALAAMEQGLSSMVPAARINRLLSLLDNTHQCSVVGIPPAWAYRQMAATETFARLSGAEFTRVGQALASQFPSLLEEGAASWSGERVVEILALLKHASTMVPEDKCWVQDRQAGLVELTLSRVLLGDMPASSAQQRVQTQITACELMLACEANTAWVGQGVVKAGLFVHQNLSRFSERFARVLIDVSPSVGVWLGVLHKPCNSQAEQAAHFANISRAFCLLVRSGHANELSQAVSAILHKLGKSSPNRSWIALLLKIANDKRRSTGQSPGVI